LVLFTLPQSHPHILWSFHLTPQAPRATIRAGHSSFLPAGEVCLARCGARQASAGCWGKTDAVFARLHRAMYQSGLRRPGSLAARRCDGSDWRRRTLPLLRRPPAQRASAAWSALPDAPPRPHRATAAAPASPLSAERFTTRRRQSGFQKSILARPHEKRTRAKFAPVLFCFGHQVVGSREAGHTDTLVGFSDCGS
jgi:hypothetical protein